jgi:DNA-binding response OmpR family regulator
LQFPDDVITASLFSWKLNTTQLGRIEPISRTSLRYLTVLGSTLRHGGQTRQVVYIIGPLGRRLFPVATKWGYLLAKDKIVVADDSRVYRLLVENALANENYELLFAKDAGEAFSLVGEHCPLILITDWEMPDASGMELCRQIRCDKSSDYVYVILLTSNSEKEQIVEGLASGADDYLTKPFDAGELLARVGVGRRLAMLQRELKAKTLLLQELALTDDLTGLPNRRAVETWAERELKAAARYSYPVWVVMMDLDHFKAINDTFGHGGRHSAQESCPGTSNQYASVEHLRTFWWRGVHPDTDPWRRRRRFDCRGAPERNS